MNVGSLEIKLFADIARLQADMNKANQTVDKAMGGIEKSVNLAKRAFLGLGASFSIGAIGSTIDAYKRFDSQLKLATKTTQEYAEAYSNVVRIAKTSQSDIGAIGVLYARLTNNLRDFGTTQKEISTITEAVSLSLRVSNATVQETNSVMLQLSQSFGSGKINGQEFLAVSEGAPIIMRQLAKSLKVTYGELKNMSTEGKLTSEVLKTALSDPAYIAALREQAKVVGTISSAFTVAKNAFTQYIGEADKGAGTSKLISQGIVVLAENINNLATVAIGAGIVAFGRFTASRIANMDAGKVAAAASYKNAVLEIESIALTKAAKEAETARTLGLDKLKIQSKIAVLTIAREEAFFAAAHVLETAKETGALKLLEAQTYKLIQAKGALAKVNGLVGVSMANNASATTKLVSEWQQAEAINGKLTNSVTLGTAAMRGFSSVVNFLGGGIGALITALGLGYLAFNKVSDFLESRATPALQKHRGEVEQLLAVERARKQLSLSKDDPYALEKKSIDDLNVSIKSTKENINRLTEANGKGTRYRVNNSALIERENASLTIFTENLKKETAALAGRENANKAAQKVAPSLYPNFTSTVATINVDEVHRRQEEEANRLKKSGKEASGNLKDADALRKKREETENKLYALEKELSDITSEREFKHLKEVRETTEKNNKIKEENANKLYALEKGLDDIISEREFEHLKRVREIKENAVKEQLKAQQELAKDINKSLTDALLRGFESGKGFAKNFRDTLVNMFKTLILQPTISAILKPLTDGVSGVLSKGLGGATGGSGGGIFGNASNLFSIGKSIYSGFSGALSSNIGGLVANFAPSLGSSIAGSMLGSAAGLGPTVAGSATGIGSLAGGIGSLGSAISTALPYIGLAITAFSVFKSLFGGAKLPPRMTASRTGTFNGKDFTSARGTLNAKGKPLGSQLDGSLDSVNKAFAESLSTLLNAFGKSSFIATRSTITKKLSTEAGFQASFSGGSVSQYEKFGKKTDLQTIFTKFANDVLGKTLAEAVGKSDLPQGIKKFFGSLDTKDKVLDAINTLVSLKKELEGLPAVFNAVRTSLNTDQYNFTAEKLKEQFAATQTFVDLFYSDSEKFGIFTKKVTSSLAELNLTIPTSRDAYRKLVESIKVTNEATNNQFSGLVALAPALDSYYKQLQQQASGINEVNKALADGLNADLFGSYADFISGKANVEIGNSSAPFIAQSLAQPGSGNADLLAEVRSLRADQANNAVTLKTVLEAVATYTYQSAKTLKQFNNDGLPATRIV